MPRMVYSYALTQCAKLGIQPTPEQQWSMVYLERCGKRFCVDFGYPNSVAEAERLYRQLPPKHRLM